MYELLDAILMRAAAQPADLDVPAWPDLSVNADPRRVMTWLHDVWSRPLLAEAITAASPALAEQTGRLLADNHPD